MSQSARGHSARRAANDLGQASGPVNQSHHEREPSICTKVTLLLLAFAGFPAAILGAYRDNIYMLSAGLIAIATAAYAFMKDSFPTWFPPRFRPNESDDEE